ncbi:putative oxidoreductase [Actinoplanes missouriensis 431]|uniref:Putative oxidoreductase n=1 Tax=Actinoplanes missouriensis (strain ATCC 14538 / DSM 43046 / CBS 188.64 / JCM 3121 / NBRC 102363 / NCIMB 12654 / NRRL B-3342 / UNCC 431) TaxID=512565 RepID=I0H4I5_ACTM4|nr:mycofactocin system GMC family oxidoreductase MftG [Actinoplanes missouriensis]BAL87922.1 putative oxidoreductase [Actinoplanes missouriensis 431]
MTRIDAPRIFGSGKPDVIVVGAGGAGAVLAARLSEDPDRTVLVVEAGTVPADPEQLSTDLTDARRVPGARLAHAAVAAHEVHLTAHRRWQVPRGRILGGSTTINGGYFVRARRADFARWAARGNPAWAYDRALPLLRRLETDLDHPASALHGGDGPMPVSRTDMRHPAAAAFHDTAVAMGFPADPDKNDQQAPGIGPVPCNVRSGVRHNTGMRYLPAAVQARPNLTVIGDCRATRILTDRGRAIGVAADYAGRPVDLHAGQVVLCAGAFATAELLLRSGIGPREDLERLGIPVIRDAPAVGSGFSDHPQLVIPWHPADRLPDRTASWLGGCLHLCSSGDPGGPGDLEILQALIPLPRLADPGVADASPLAFLVADQSPRPTGRLRLAAAALHVAPVIDYGYLRTPDSYRNLREAVRTTAALLDTRPLAGLHRGLLDPPPSILDDDRSLNRWIRDHLGTSQHTCGTAPMGDPDDHRTSAADQYGRVHGVRGLRIADTSLLPDAPLRGPAATAVLIGELIADALRNELT